MLREILSAALTSAPIWISVLLVFVWFDTWLNYKRREWIKAQGAYLLEIKLPREMPKSPVAMELFFNTINSSSVGTLGDALLKGRVRNTFSLEIVSIDGGVHFYIYCDKNYRERVETQLYAQFSNVEVHEVADYALDIHYNPEKLKFGWFGQFTLTKPDAFPIKTYIEYGLDKDPDEELKNDPLVALLEFMGSLKKGEQAWIQILLRGHAKEDLKHGRLITKPDWKNSIKEEIKKFIKENVPAVEGKEKQPTVRDLTKGQQDVVTGIERTSGKMAFDTMIRATYFAEPTAFKPSNIGGLIGSISQFNAGAWNGFKPGFRAGYDYKWQDPFGKKKVKNEQRLLEAYKRRSFFNPPFKNFHGKVFILTTEELATLFHFPSAVTAATPTLARIPSKKAEAPANLPV